MRSHGLSMRFRRYSPAGSPRPFSLLANLLTSGLLPCATRWMGTPCQPPSVESMRRPPLST
jgi:hypothetical protein